MSGLKIVERHYHANGHSAPFYTAIVDDPKDGDTKLVIMFEDPDYTAVFSLDKLIDNEDISKNNSYNSERFEILRDDIWDMDPFDK
jgi:hypothetical protein